uniref:Uncharacterized protein n=1 Tax=viral metagenome TaxID=1070528 RepID=A0A6M3KIF9_9ZZZZ
MDKPSSRDWDGIECSEDSTTAKKDSIFIEKASYSIWQWHEIPDDDVVIIPKGESNNEIDPNNY